MPKRELLHEWMHRLHHLHVQSPGAGYWRIFRVWTKRNPESGWEEFHEQRKILERCLVDTDPLEPISKLDFVNAAEEVNDSGNGRLVYVDWP